MLDTPYVLLPILAAAVLFVVAASGFRTRRVPGALPFGISMVLAGIQALAYALEVGAPDLPTKILAEQLAFPALAGLPVGLFWMSLEYTGRRGWLTRFRAALLLAIPVVSALAGLALRHNVLFRFNHRLMPVGPFTVPVSDVDPLFMVNALYANCLLLVALVLLLTALPGASPVYRRRTLILVASILLPTVSHALFLSGTSPVPGYNITPSLTVFTGLLLAWGVFRLRLMELVPIARTTVIDNLPDLVIVLDAQEHVVDLNPAALQTMRLRRAEAVGKTLEVVCAKWSGACGQLRAAHTGTEEVTFGDGEDARTYQVSVSPIKDRGGSLLGRVLVLHDVTELKRAREAAESATRAKSAFLASVSHEIRTPMNVILGFAQLMARDPTLSELHRSEVDLVRSSGEHLLSLLDETLDMSRIEAGRMVVEPVSTDLHALVKGVENILLRQAREKRLSLVVSLDPGVPRSARVDARRLRQILINLLGNALKFTPTGSVALHVSRLPGGMPGRVQRVRFAVEDTGVGIAPGEMAALFEPFTQASGGRAVQQGTGLGLALSRQLAHLMGGDLSAESELGQGSTFTLDLPLEVLVDDAAAGPPVAPERRVLGLAPGQPQRRVLVVDDHAPNRRLLVSLLAALDSPSEGGRTLDIREAATAAEATAAFGAWRPHLVFLDMRLPDGSGAEVAASIRGLEADGPPAVLFGLSASVLEEDRAAFFEAGCNAFFGKPYREAEIFAAVGQHLGLRFRYEGEPTPAQSGRQEAGPRRAK